MARYRVVVQISRDAAPDRNGRVWSTSFGLPMFWVDASSVEAAEATVMDMLASLIPEDSATTTSAHIGVVRDDTDSDGNRIRDSYPDPDDYRGASRELKPYGKES